MSRCFNILSNESGEYVTYQSDAHGFNNPIGGEPSRREVYVSLHQTEREPFYGV
jgi:hypothetical protein